MHPLVKHEVQGLTALISDILLVALCLLAGFLSAFFSPALALVVMVGGLIAAAIYREGGRGGAFASYGLWGFAMVGIGLVALPAMTGRYGGLVFVIALPLSLAAAVIVIGWRWFARVPWRY